MFNSIRGILSEKCFDSIKIETSGIEWDLAVSARALDEFGSAGSSVRAFVWLHHREDIMKLYGFPKESDRKLFLDLLKVDGVGPKQALKIMSGISSHDFEHAIEDEDLVRLERVPGLGKKTAQKLVFALKGKIVPINSSVTGVVSSWDDVINALTDMGYERKSAQSTIKEIISESGMVHSPENEKEIFRRAIILLSS